MVISAQNRYTRTANVLHWLILAPLVAQYIVGWTMPHIGRNTPVTTLISLHFSIGVLILGVIIVRSVWRIIHREPTPEAGHPAMAGARGTSHSPAAVPAAGRSIAIGLDQRLVSRHADHVFSGSSACRNWWVSTPPAGAGPVTFIRLSRNTTFFPWWACTSLRRCITTSSAAIGFCSACWRARSVAKSRFQNATPNSNMVSP